MTLGRKIHNAANHKFFEQPVQGRAVANVALPEHITLGFRQRFQVLWIPGVGQLVEIDYPQSGIVFEHPANKVRTDESTPTSDQ